MGILKNFTDVLGRHVSGCVVASLGIGLIIGIGDDAGVDTGRTCFFLFVT